MGDFIGLEVATSAAARDCAVTLVEAVPGILIRGVPTAVVDRRVELGSREMTATSNLGLSIVCDAGSENPDSDGPRPLAPSRYSPSNAMPTCRRASFITSSVSRLSVSGRTGDSASPSPTQAARWTAWWNNWA